MDPLILNAFIPPALYAATNHIDKYLISRIFGEEGGVGSLLIFSSLFGAVILPIALIINPSLLHIPALSAGILIASGIIWVLALFLYFKALFEDEASFVAPFFQIIPVFGFFLGFMLLGETLTSGQFIGSIIILLGATLLAFRQEDEGLRFNYVVVIMMIIASALFASNDVLFKFVGLEVGFWSAAFWQYVGMALVAIGFFFVPTYRKDFIQVWKNKKAAALGLNIGNETITLVGDMILSFSLFLAPVALIQTMSATQPLFILVYGIILTIFFPHILKESLEKKNLIQKILAVLVMVVGGIVLVL